MSTRGFNQQALEKQQTQQDVQRDPNTAQTEHTDARPIRAFDTAGASAPPDAPRLNKHKVLQLQRTLGNQAVGRIVQRRRQQKAIMRFFQQDDPCNGCGAEVTVQRRPARQHAADVMRDGSDAAEGQDEESITRQVLNTIMPVTTGYYLDGELGITPAYPIHIAEGSTNYVYRMSANKIRVTYRQNGTLAFDTGAGVSIGLSSGRRGGGGGQGYGWGAELGAQFQAGVQVVVLQEYEIPIDDLTTYLFNNLTDRAIDTILGAATGGIVGDSAISNTSFGQAFELSMSTVMQEHEQYETRRQVEFVPFAQGDAEASIGRRGPARQAGVHGHTRDGSRPAGRPGGSWSRSHRDDPDQPPRETHAERRDRLQNYWFNRLLMPSLILGGRLQLAIGHESTFNEGDDGRLATELKIYFDGGHTLNLPIVSQLPLIGASNIGAAFIFKLKEAEDGGSVPDLERFKVQVYSKRGETDQSHYAGEASQESITYDMTEDFNLEQISGLLSGDVSVLPSTSSVLDTLTNENVEFEVLRRYIVGGPMGGAFNTFMRRYRTTRVMQSDLSGSSWRTQWRNRAQMLDISTYFTVRFKVNGADLNQILEAAGAAGQAIMSGEIGGDAAERAEQQGGNRFEQMYNTVSNFLNDFHGSEQGQAFEAALLDNVYVDQAIYRIQAGAGFGGQIQAAEGAKLRLSGFLRAGAFCEENLANRFDESRITLRSFANYAVDAMDDPWSVTPDCPLLEALADVARRLFADGEGSPGEGDDDGEASGGSNAAQPGATITPPSQGDQEQVMESQAGSEATVGSGQDGQSAMPGDQQASGQQPTHRAVREEPPPNATEQSYTYMAVAVRSSGDNFEVGMRVVYHGNTYINTNIPATYVEELAPSSDGQYRFGQFTLDDTVRVTPEDAPDSLYIQGGTAFRAILWNESPANQPNAQPQSVPAPAQ